MDNKFKSYEYNKGYIKEYLTKKVEEIKFRVPAGEKKNIQEYAASKGESVNAFIYRAIQEAMERDS